MLEKLPFLASRSWKNEERACRRRRLSLITHTLRVASKPQKNTQRAHRTHTQTWGIWFANSLGTEATSACFLMELALQKVPYIVYELLRKGFLFSSGRRRRSLMGTGTGRGRLISISFVVIVVDVWELLYYYNRICRRAGFICGIDIHWITGVFVYR